MEKQGKALQTGLASLYKSKKLSDLTITCGPYSFKVHQAIFRTWTEYFQAVLTFQVINLKAIGAGDQGEDDSCDDPEAVRHMVHFFYHLDYEAGPPKNTVNVSITSSTLPPMTPKNEPSRGYRRGVRRGATSYGRVMARPLVSRDEKAPDGLHGGVDGDNNMVVHARVFALAVKYQIPALKDLAASKFASAVESDWNHSSLTEALRVVHSTTPEDARELRDIVAKVLLTHEKLLDKPEVESAVLDIRRLAYELLRRSKGLPAVATSNPEPSCCNCGSELLSTCKRGRTCFACAFGRGCPYCS